MKKLQGFITVLWLMAISAASLMLSEEAAAVPSTQFTVSGHVNSAATFTLSDLSGLTPTTVSVGADSYTGVSLWSLLNDAVGITTDPSIKNDILRDYVVATGSDGYSVVFSLGEINPNFGNQLDLIAFEQNGNPLSGDGFARIIVPGDNKHGRWVSNLVSLEVFSVGGAPSGGSHPVSTQFTLSGQIDHHDVITATDLPGSLVPKIVTVSSQPIAGSSFTGVNLWSLINNAGIETDPQVKNDILRKYVLATGSDGYEVVFSMGEIHPNFGGQPDLVAYATGSDPLSTDGFARIIVPGDVRAGRYVSNLTNLEVRSSVVPEPGTVTLLLAGLAALGLYGVRRHRIDDTVIISSSNLI